MQKSIRSTSVQPQGDSLGLMIGLVQTNHLRFSMLEPTASSQKGKPCNLAHAQHSPPRPQLLYAQSRQQHTQPTSHLQGKTCVALLQLHNSCRQRNQPYLHTTHGAAPPLRQPHTATRHQQTTPPSPVPHCTINPNTSCCNTPAYICMPRPSTLMPPMRSRGPRLRCCSTLPSLPPMGNALALPPAAALPPPPAAPLRCSEASSGSILLPGLMTKSILLGCGTDARCLQCGTAANIQQARTTQREGNDSNAAGTLLMQASLAAWHRSRLCGHNEHDTSSRRDT